MEKEFKKVIFEYLYDKLNLKEFEDFLVKLNLKHKEMPEELEKELASKYFILINEINTDQLENIEEYNRIVKNINTLPKEEIYHYLDNNIEKLLIPKERNYYKIGFKNIVLHEAPNDGYVFQISYIKNDGSDLKEITKKDIKLSNAISFMENKYNEQNIIVHFIKDNEIRFK